jgi:hypothetical protein
MSLFTSDSGIAITADLWLANDHDCADLLSNDMIIRRRITISEKVSDRTLIGLFSISN